MFSHSFIYNFLCNFLFFHNASISVVFAMKTVFEFKSAFSYISLQSLTSICQHAYEGHINLGNSAFATLLFSPQVLFTVTSLIPTS